MFVCHFSSDNSRTIEGINAARTHLSLAGHGCDSVLLVKERGGTTPGVVEVRAAETPTDWANMAAKQFHENYILAEYKSNCEVNNGVVQFNFPHPGTDVALLPVVREARVHHLHSVSGFLSPLAIRRVAELGKPIVWTVSDSRVFTGGCHGTFGCDGFLRECSPCPQLNDFDPCVLPKTMLENKTALLADLDLTLIAPTEASAELIRKSPQFGDKRVEVVGLPVSSTQYRTSDWSHRLETRRRHGIDSDSVVLMFVNDAYGSKTSGESMMREMLQRALMSPGFRQRCLTQEVVLVVLGDLTFDRAGLDIATTFLPDTLSDEERSDLFGMADLMIMPPLSDHVPKHAVEAMKCGLPLLAFDHGPFRDIVSDGDNGRLVNPILGSTGYTEAFLKLIETPGALWRFGRRACRTIEARHTSDHVARRLMEIYSDIAPTFRKSSSLSERFAHGTAARASLNYDYLNVPELLDFPITLAQDRRNAAFLRFMDLTLPEIMEDRALAREHGLPEGSRPAIPGYHYERSIYFGLDLVGNPRDGNAYLGAGWSSLEGYGETTAAMASIRLSLPASPGSMVLDLAMMSGEPGAETVGVFWDGAFIRNERVDQTLRTLEFPVPVDVGREGSVVTVSIKTRPGARIRLDRLCIRSLPGDVTPRERSASIWAPDAVRQIDRELVQHLGMRDDTVDRIHEAWLERGDLRGLYSLDRQSGWVGMMTWCATHGVMEHVDFDRYQWIDLHAALRRPCTLIPNSHGGGLTNLAVGLHMLRQDLRDAFDILTPDGVQALNGWVEDNARAEYPQLTVPSLLARTTTRGAGNVGMSENATLELLRVWAIRPDIRDQYDVNTLDGYVAFCGWFWLWGRFEGYEVSIQTLLQVMRVLQAPYEDDLPAPNGTSIPRIAKVIHGLREDLAQAFDLHGDAGRQEILVWLASSGAREYRLRPLGLARYYTG